MNRVRSAVARILTREFLSHWGIAFASGVGALSGLVALLPRLDLNVARSVLILLSCALGATIYAAGKTRRIHLPVDELAPPGLSPGQFMTVAVECNRALLAQVHELANYIYGVDVPPIPFERYEQWLSVNCNILACLLDQNQRAIGYFDVLPLDVDFAERFVQGEVGEQDIRQEHILPPDGARHCKYLYLAGFAIADPGTPAGGRHASCLLWALRRYLERFYHPFDNKQLIAIGATPEGERILQRYNFQLIQPAKLQRDGFPMYAATLSSRLARAMSTMPDWSGACRLSWEKPALRGQPTRLSNVG